MIELYLGQREPKATLRAASKLEETCEAQFYIGELHFLRTNRAEAESTLRVAAETCPNVFIEYEAAVAELQRL